MKVKYAVVYERAPNNFSAYVPELAGCIGTGKTLDDAREMIREAITFHIEDLAKQGEVASAPKMSIGEAMSYHIASLSEADQTVPETETTFGVVEVEAEQEPLPAARGL